MSDQLFCYGTLRAAPVFEKLVGRPYPNTSALLKGYGCFTVKGEVYPGIKPIDGAAVEGVVYQGLCDQAFQALDDFEGEMYSRRLLTVDTDKGQALSVWCYVIKPEWQYMLADEVWVYADKEEAFLKRFLSAGDF